MTAKDVVEMTASDGRIKKAGHTEAPEPAHQHLLKKTLAF
jgi:hypothetical protein